MGSAARTPSAGSASPAIRRPVAGAIGRSGVGSGSTKGYVERLDDVVGRSGGRISGGVRVAAATERAGDRGEIHRLGPHRHRPAPRFDLLEHRGYLGLLGGAHDVDDALDFLGSRI